MGNKLIRFLIFMLSILITSCTHNKPRLNQLSDLQNSTMGMISTGISYDNASMMIQKLIGGPPHKIIFYKDGKELLAALKSGDVDAIPVHQFVADYLLKRDPELKQIPVQDQFEGGVIMAVRSDDLHLKTQLDSAITVLKENGEMKALEDKWITNLPVSNEPSNFEIPKIEGAKTVRVGVSGEHIPIDFIAANGHPAGFNVAILAEIGRILNINFEFVILETQDRFTALYNKKIDLVYCHFQSSDTSYFNDLKTRKWVGTIPYFTYRNGCFLVMK